MTKSILKLKPLSEALGVEIMDISIEGALKPNVFTEVYKNFVEVFRKIRTQTTSTEKSKVHQNI